MASTDKIEAFLAEPRNVIVAGIRRDGRPHLSPNWFYWDGQRFYVSTTRDRVKYAIFRRDPRAQLLIDDPAGFRAVLVPATVEIREDPGAELPRFRAIREKHGMGVLDDEEHLRALTAEDGFCWPSPPTAHPQAGRAGAWTDRPNPPAPGGGPCDGCLREPFWADTSSVALTAGTAAPMQPSTDRMNHALLPVPIVARSPASGMITHALHMTTFILSASDFRARAGVWEC
jgi:PPOX class probable F420-dependent enzyme